MFTAHLSTLLGVNEQEGYAGQLVGETRVKSPTLAKTNGARMGHPSRNVRS